MLSSCMLYSRAVCGHLCVGALFLDKKQFEGLGALSTRQSSVVLVSEDNISSGCSLYLAVHIPSPYHFKTNHYNVNFSIFPCRSFDFR